MQECAVMAILEAYSMQIMTLDSLIPDLTATPKATEKANPCISELEGLVRLGDDIPFAVSSKPEAIPGLQRALLTL